MSTTEYRAPLRESLNAARDHQRRLAEAEQEVYRRLGMPSQHPDPKAAGAELVAELAAARDRVLDEIRAEKAENSAARRAQWEADQVAERAAVERAEQDRRAAIDAVPADELSDDDEVTELEERIASGDDTVTVEDLQRAREAATGRKRFARLRDVFADRQARREAERAEREAAAAAQEHARTVLGPYAPAEMVPLYDQAVAAVRAYTEALVHRDAAVRSLTALPPVERHRGVTVDQRNPVAMSVDLDGHEYRLQNIASHVRRVLEAAGIAPRSLDVVDRTLFALDDHDPAIVAEGRAQLATRKGRRSAS